AALVVVESKLDIGRHERFLRFEPRMPRIAILPLQARQWHSFSGIEIDVALRRNQGKVRRDKPYEQHPWSIAACMIAKPGDGLVADRLVVGTVFRGARPDLAKSDDVVPCAGNRIADRSPHLPDAVHEMHGPMLQIEPR